MDLNEAPLEAIGVRIQKARQRVLLASPYLGTRVVGYLASAIESRQEAIKELDIRVLTSLNRSHFTTGASSREAVETLMEAEATMRSILNLHAKVVVIDDWALVGSSNLTEFGLDRGNLELGVELTGRWAGEVSQRFERWWRDAGKQATIVRTDLRRLPRAPRKGARIRLGETSKGRVVPVAGKRAPDFASHLDKLERESAINRLKGGLLIKGFPLADVARKRMPKKRSLAYRDCRLLRSNTSLQQSGETRDLLIEVLIRHKDVSARAHAAYRLGHDEHMAAEQRGRRRIRTELVRARRQESPVVRRAASRALVAFDRAHDNG